MSSSSNQTFKSFAVAGGVGGGSPFSASLGNVIVKALLSRGLDVRVLARGESASSKAAKELETAGAKIVEVDYASEDSLVHALSGVEVVISALSGGGLAVQSGLADAAKNSGVSLFVPSEFGFNTDELLPADHSYMHGKKGLRGHLRSIGLPYFAVYTGAFAEFVRPLFTTVSSDNELEIIGEGDAKSSFTAIPDIAAFVAESTSTVPLERLANQAIGITGIRTSVKEIAERTKVKQPEIIITHRSIEDVTAEYERTQDFVLWLKLQYALGRGKSEGQKGQAGREKEFYPGWSPKPIENFV